MTKATVHSGDTLSLSGRSITIGVAAGAANPVVLLALADGTARGPVLTAGRAKIYHSKHDLVELGNMGDCDLEVEFPAPGIGDPRFEEDI